MAQAAPESSRQLFGAFIQEFAGALLLFLLQWPFVGVFGNTWTAWVVHFFTVMLCDIISQGSQVNPSVSVAMFVYGAITFHGAVVRIIAQVLAGVLAYPLLVKLSPSYIGIGGPSKADNVDVPTAAIAEFSLTFLLLMLIYVACNVIGLPGQRPVIAAGIRGLIILGGPYTGPSMNPMIAFGWAVYTNNYKNFEHFLVYWIAPTVGAVLATVLFVVVQAAVAPKADSDKKKDE